MMVTPRIIEVKNYPEIDGLYQHYKGGKYRVLTMATNSETGEPEVVYKSVPFGTVYTRPLSLWNEMVRYKTSAKSKVILAPRFSLIVG